MKLFILLFLLPAVFVLHAEPVYEKAMYTENRYSEYYTFYYDRVVSDDGGRTYRIITCVPKKPAPEKGFRSVYALDGNAVIHHITEKELKKLYENDPPVIIAIGYDTNELFDMPSRTFDFTPSGDNKPVQDELDPTRMGGGALIFLNFIEKTVFPLSEKKVRTDSGRRTLFGHSYGGLFVLSALSERPKLFSTYVSADPALWWQKGFLYGKLEEMKPDERFEGKKLFILKGGYAAAYEKSEKDSEKVRLRKILYASVPKDAALETVRRLSAAGLKTVYSEYGYLSHGPLFPVSLEAALSAEEVY
jgi:predicted alpha/beta superfamily hydrolase